MMGIIKKSKSELYKVQLFHVQIHIQFSYQHMAELSERRQEVEVISNRAMSDALLQLAYEKDKMVS